VRGQQHHQAVHNLGGQHRPGDEQWLKAEIDERRVEPNSGLGEAIGYMLKYWEPLTLFLREPGAPLDNNIAERAVRGIAVGKKNYLFAGSDAGGESAAVIYTLIETSKLNGVEPHAWLSSVVECINDHPMKRIDDLLPWNFTPCAS